MPSYLSNLSKNETSFASQSAPSSQKTEPSSSHSHSPLPAVVSKWNLVCFMILITVFIPSISSVQVAGPSALLYWIIGGLTFLVPSIVITQWIGRRFPGQGAPYVWATRILGSRWSFLVAFCAWWPGVLNAVSALEVGLIFIRTVEPTWCTTPLEQCFALLLTLLIATTIACLPLRILKRILCLLAISYLAVCLLVGGAGIYWLWEGHPSAVAFTLSTPWHFSGNTTAVYGIVIMMLLGVDVPLFLGGEIRGGRVEARRASSYVWWGGGLAFAAYLVATFGTMVVVPTAQAGSMWASIEALSLTFGAPVGQLAMLILIVTQLAITTAYLLMYSRLILIMAREGRLPLSLAHVNRHGVPVRSIVTFAATMASVILISVGIVPALFASMVSSADMAAEIYNVLMAGAAVLWDFSTALLFVLVPCLLFRHRRFWREQGWRRTPLLLLSLAIMGIGAAFVGIWMTITSSWLPMVLSDGHWAQLVGGVTAASVVLGWVASEIPRLHTLLKEERQMRARELALRTQLEQAHTEQEALLLRQQALVAELDQLYQEQRYVAITDPITGLPNHRAIMAQVEEGIAQSLQAGETCAVIFMDIDHFKSINDTWGHRAGDLILHEVGRRLRSTIRHEDSVGRYGGEEFSLLLTRVSVEEAVQTAEHLRSVIAACPYLLEGEEQQQIVEVSGSFGVAVSGVHGNTKSMLMEYADRAMYCAKRMGRNRVCLADDEKMPDAPQALRDSSSHLGEEALTVRALTAIAMIHDGPTSAHACRMTSLAEATARILGCSEDDVHLLRLGTLFHDIGKIGISETILHKAGPLTAEEWEIMRQHPVLGQQILLQIGGIFERLSLLVVAHHERWDGGGYPYGLFEEAIPLGARILAVVDSYDAMTSQRPYRKPMSTAQAQTELQRCAGSQYDPRVVEAFLQVPKKEVTEEDYLLAVAKS